MCNLSALRKFQMQWKTLFEKIKSAFLHQADTQDPKIAFSETEFVRHPTLGVGTPLPDIEHEVRHVINTSKIEVDRLSGNTFVNQYLIIKDLGDGSFGKVKLVLNMEDNCLYALKAVSKLQVRREMFRGKALESDSTNNVLLREITFMKSLQHPNVVQLYEVIADPSSDKVVMILEYVDGGEVLRSDMLGPPNHGFSEQVARRHFRDLIKGLEYLHHRNIIHRDIKPGNLLLTQDGRVKLSDFGSAYYFPDGNDLVVDSAGTRLFFAPESCGQGDPYHGKKADVYAAGVVLYMMIFAKAPFESDNDFELLRKIREEEPDFTSRTNLSIELLDLLKKLLCKDPDTRPSVDQVFDHPWITDGARLHQIIPFRDLTLPKGPESRVSLKSGITPSITGIVDQIPNKQTRKFKAGEYLVKEGQVLNGWYLIRRGYCEATSTEWDYEQEYELADGDSDFQEDDEDGTSPETTQPISPFLSASAQDLTVLQESGEDALAKFKSLPKDEILKGIGRRDTEMHSHIKHVVETAFEDYCKTTVTSLERSKNGRLRGPGAVVGLDLSANAVESKRTVKALGDVQTIFVQKEALSEVLARPENQLPARLFKTKLQRIETMRNVVEGLAGLHSDVVLLEKLRTTLRNQT